LRAARCRILCIWLAMKIKRPGTLIGKIL